MSKFEKSETRAAANFGQNPIPIISAAAAAAVQLETTLEKYDKEIQLKCS